MVEKCTYFQSCLQQYRQQPLNIVSLLLVLLGLPRGNDEVIFVKEEHFPLGKVKKGDPVDWKAFGQVLLVLAHVLVQA